MAWRVYSYMSLGGAEGAVIMELIPGLIVMTEGISGLNLIGATLSSGIFIGIGIIYGHELSHTKGFGFVISRMILIGIMSVALQILVLFKKVEIFIMLL